MKRLTLLLLFVSSAVFSQKSIITLDSCIQMAKRNYPLIKQNNLIEQVSKNNSAEANKNWLPHTSFSSKAVYQSEAISFLGTSFPKDSYVGSLSIEQMLFDGGQIKQQKNIEALNAANETAKNEVELYKLIDRVNQLYSNILLSRENLKTLNIYKNDIDNKKSVLASSLQNGMILQSNLDELEAEELKTDQSVIETKDNIDALYQSLAMFINKTITDSTVLPIQPVISTASGNDILRPEEKLFSTQKDLVEARYKLTSKISVPKLSVFGDENYGRPGYNFLNQNVRFFGEAGVSLKWNISSLYSISNEKQNLSISRKMIDVQKEVFEFNLKTQLATQSAQINSLKNIIEKDKLIIEKRHNIKLTAGLQLENGSITSTDYLTELNAEMQALLNQKIHEIKLMNMITSYNTSKGINNF